MRLHLPKGLLAALLAACFALPAGAEGETTTQYGWSDGAPATSKDGITWTNIKYDDDNTLSTITGNTIALGTSGDVKITAATTDGAWGTGSSVTGTADSAWFDMVGDKRIYLSCPDINKMSNVYLNGVHFVIGTGNSNKDKSNDITSNLFLGSGTWANDLGSVHYMAVLRANVDANISGNVTLTDSSAHISTWGGSDITFGGSLNGNGKSLSVGAEAVGSVINLNGTTDLGSLTVGAKADMSGPLSAKGTAISVVIGASSAAEIGNLTLLSGSTLTNNGQLTISGSYYGGAITQGNGGELILSKDMSLNMDGMTALFGSQKNDEQSGFQSYDATYTLVQGGSVTDNGAKFKVGGESFTGSYTVGDDGVCKFSCTESRYNLISGEETSIQDVETAAGLTSAYFIEVSGVLTGVSDDTLTHGIRGTGNIQIGNGDQLSYSTLSEKGTGFTGTLKLDGGSIKMDVEGGNLSNTISVLSDSSLKLSGMMSVGGNVTATQGKTLSISLAEDATSGELLFLGTVGKLDGAKLQIEDGVTVSVFGRSDGNAQIAGAIVVNGGGTLKLTSQDTLGYDGGNYTDSITLQGTTDKTAALNLTATQTLTTSLILKGNTSITGEAMNSFGGSITVTGTNNVISNEVLARKLLSINVENAGDSLQMSNITRSPDTNRDYSFTKKGAGLLTITGDVGTSGKIIENATVQAGKMVVQGAFYGGLTQQGGETVLGGNSTITTMTCTGGSVETKGETTTISTLTGSGTFKTSAGSATVTDASGFTGTLESTGGTLSAVSGSGASLAAIKATGGSVSLMSTADSISVAKIDVGTDGNVSVSGQSGDFKVTVTDLVIGESGSKFVSNLDVTGSLSVQVGSNGQTGGLNMAPAATPSGTLTLGSASGTGLELNLSYLPVMTTGDSLTLFKGVDEVLYYGIISAGTGETEATAVTLSDPAPLTGTGVDASVIFKNVDKDYFTVKFENNIVALVAKQNVPEPTTATLSLLALMGLAARRRRRKA